MELLYKGQVVLCPLERGCPLLGGNNVLSLWEVEIWGLELVLCSEVVLFSEVTNVLSLWEVEIWGLELVLCSEVVLFSEVTNVLSLWEVEIWGLELVLCSEVHTATGALT